MVATRIFLSYRRADTQHLTGRLFDRLRRVFGSQVIFQDVEGIELGDHLDSVITAHLTAADIVIAVIGSRWLLDGDSGQPRIDEAQDWVRLEIEYALVRGARIIPVYVDEAPILGPEDLPPSLASLAGFNSERLDARIFDEGIQRLVRRLRRLIPASSSTSLRRQFEQFARQAARESTPRRAALGAVDSWLRHSRSRCFVLTGAPGTGKTTVAAQLVQAHLGKETYPDLPSLQQGFLSAIHFCRANHSGWLHAIDFCSSLGEQIESAFMDDDHGALEAGAPVATPQDAWVQFVFRPLMWRSSRAEKFCLLLIDGLDEAASYRGDVTIASLLRELPRLPPYVRLIVTMRPGPVQTTLLDFFRGQPGVESLVYSLDTPEASSEIEDFIRRRAQDPGLAQMLVPTKYDQDPISALGRLSDGNFLVASTWLDSLSLRATSADLAAESNLRSRGDIQSGDLQSALLTTAYRLFLRQFVERWGAEYWRDGLKPLLGLLAVAREPLDRALLEALTGTSRQELKRLLGVLTPFLRGHEIQSASYSLFHQSFADHLLDENDAGDEFWCDPVEQHGRIHQCLSELALPWRQHSTYCIRHLAAHDLGRLRPEPPSSLQDPSYWLEKTSRMGLQALIEDFRLAHERFPEFFALILRALSRIDRWRAERIGASELMQQILIELARMGESTWRQTCRQWLASRSVPFDDLLWSARPPGEQMLLFTLFRQKAAVTVLATPKNGSFILAGLASGALEAWDLESRSPIFSSRSQTHAISALAINESLPGDSQARAVVGSDHGELKIVDARSGHELASPEELHDEEITAILLCSDGALACSTDTAGSVVFWRLADGECQRRHRTGEDPIRAAAKNETAGRIVTLSAGGKLTGWSFESLDFTSVARIRRPDDSLEFSALALAPDGDIAFCAVGSEILSVEVSNGKIRSRFRLKSGAVKSLIALASGGLLIGGSDAILSLWSVDGQLQQTLGAHAGAVNAIASIHGPDRLVSASHDGTAKVWDLQLDDADSPQCGHRTAVQSAVFLSSAEHSCPGDDRSGDGLVTIDAAGVVRTWSDDGCSFDGWVVPGASVISLRILGPNPGQEPRLVGELEDPSVAPVVWSLETGLPISRPASHDSAPFEALVRESEIADHERSAANSFLAVDTPFLGAHLEVSAAASWAATCHPGPQEPLTIWHLDRGVELSIVRNRGRWLRGLALSGDGSHLIYAVVGLAWFDATRSATSFAGLSSAAAQSQPRLEIHLIKPPREESLCSWQLPFELRISSLAIDGHGEIAAVGDVDGQIHLLDARDGSLEKVDPITDAEVTRLAFTAENDALIAGHSDGTIASIAWPRLETETLWHAASAVRSLAAASSVMGAGLASGEVLVWKRNQPARGPSLEDPS